MGTHEIIGTEIDDVNLLALSISSPHDTSITLHTSYDDALASFIECLEACDVEYEIEPGDYRFEVLDGNNESWLADIQSVELPEGVK